MLVENRQKPKANTNATYRKYYLDSTYLLGFKLFFTFYLMFDTQSRNPNTKPKEVRTDGKAQQKILIIQSSDTDFKAVSMLS